MALVLGSVQDAKLTKILDGCEACVPIWLPQVGVIHGENIKFLIM